MTPDVWAGLMVFAIIAFAVIPIAFFRWLDVHRWQRAHEWHADREERYKDDGTT